MIGKLPVQKLLFLVLFFVVQYSASGQYTSENGLFFVDQIRGCPGLTVTITNNNPVCDCVVCACNFDYNGDGMFTVQPDKYRYTYDDPGTYRMEILFSGTSDYITITIEDKGAPDFQLQRCSANGVEVTVNDSNYDSYDIDFGDGSPMVNVPASAPQATYFYGTSNTFPITVRGNDTNSANNCPTTTQSFDALPTLAPAVIESVQPIDNNTAEITFTPGDANTLYSILRSTSGGSFQNVGQIYPTTPGSQTTLVTGLDMSNAYYCFLLESVDPCSGANVSSPTQGCTIQLNTENNNGNRLTWAGRNPDTEFEIYRDGALLATVPLGDRLYIDNDIICGQTYCYSVRGISAITMLSLEECITADSNEPPPAVEDLSIRPEGSGIAMNWVYTGTAEFDVYRSIDGSQPDLLTTVTTTEFIDMNVGNAQDFEYCYEIVPKDACANANPNNSIGCAYTPSGGIDSQDNVNLSWRPYTGYLAGVDFYDVEKSYDGRKLYFDWSDRRYHIFRNRYAGRCPGDLLSNSGIFNEWNGPAFCFLYDTSDQNQSVGDARCIYTGRRWSE